jgi:hypothetical protein
MIHSYGTNFGIDVAISGDGNVVAITANEKAGSAGQGAYVFDYDSATDIFTQRPGLCGYSGIDTNGVLYLAGNHNDGQ